jgi:hypothetical protein
MIRFAHLLRFRIKDSHYVHSHIQSRPAESFAALTVHFYSAKLPDGRVLPIDARVFRVDNAREQVNGKGEIEGIRSTGTLGNSAENKISSLAQIDPTAYLFFVALWSRHPRVCRTGDSLQRGYGVSCRIPNAVITTQTSPPSLPEFRTRRSLRARRPLASPLARLNTTCSSTQVLAPPAFALILLLARICK